MRLKLIVCLLLFVLLMSSALAENDDDNGDEVTFKDFNLNLGDRIDVGDYKMELIEIQSVRDGLAVMRVSRAGGALDEQRAFLIDSANSFDGGAERGGVTVTVTDIFDEQSAKVRIEYKESLGSARKRASERPAVPPDRPEISVQKSFDKSQIRVGDEVKVTITVKNTGTGQALNIAVDDAPPLPEFSYVAGYPPRIRETLDPGQSDSAVYVMSAVKEGSVRVPAVQVTYTDSRKNPKSNSSEPFDIQIGPPSRADLAIELEGPASLSVDGEAPANVSIKNMGTASATRIVIEGDVKPPEGLAVTNLERSIFEIQPGAQENYSMHLTGRTPGDYVIVLKAGYDGGDGTRTAEAALKVSVLEREYKYLYLLIAVPVVIVAVWMYRRYREYKY
ncbi:MAG TPA: BatD family protein [Methanothrix sp.]|mgnify:FL=1|nr:DUF11 domain-containing protein [Methanothrix sp.]HOV81081.1 BatD family protein [Methanothrix sp.]HPC88905.1 BatD family protein [Methanothrix sp.]HQE86682.1 BatD family protein [Methanothrix sp.]HQI67212.1 BatD family protein [Methanothrix sp.]